MKHSPSKTHRKEHLIAIACIQCLALVIAALSGCATSYMIVDPLPPPPSHGEISDSWIEVGLNHGHHLSLLPNGIARLVSVYFRDEPYKYFADNWILDGENLSIDFQSVNDEREPVYLRARATQNCLYVSISMSPNTPLPARLFSRESDFDKYLSILRETHLSLSVPVH